MPSSKFLNGCDEVMAFSFMAMIFFLPIAPAIIEWSFGIAFLTFIVKRTSIFLDRYREEKFSRSQTKFFFLKSFKASYKPVENILNTPIGIYLLVCFLSIIFSHHPQLSMKAFVFKMLQSTFTFFLFIESINSEKRLKLFLSVFLVSIFLIVCDGLYQFLSGIDFLRQHPITDGRVTSAFKHANDFGGYLVVVLPFLLSLILFSNGNCMEKISNREVNLVGGINVQSRKFKGIMIILILIAFFCLGATYSRGAWVGFVGALLFFLLKKQRYRGLLLISLLVLFLVFGLKLTTQRSQIVNGLNIVKVEDLIDSSGRWGFWRNALEIIQDYPVLGSGFNTYAEVIGFYAPQTRVYPHNCYLQMAAELGILGLCSFIWILVRFFKGAFREMKKLRDPLLCVAHYGLLAGFSGFLLHSFFDTNFYSTKLNTLMWLTMAVIISIHPVAKNEAVLTDKI